MRAAPIALFVAVLALAGCTGPRVAPLTAKPAVTVDHSEAAQQRWLWLDRVTWGATPAEAAQLAELGVVRFLDQQLDAKAMTALPPEVQAQLDAMSINQKSLLELTDEVERLRKASEDATGDVEKRRVARQAYQRELNRLSAEASTRAVLLAQYSPHQLREQMVWFWLNHFSVFQGKANLRAMVGDYEASAIRPHALGRFRDLLGATVHHPAMLRYLDNERNGVNAVNENYARELLELHTLGVDGGYTQKDVQELARILTGVGVNLGKGTPRLRKALEPLYVRQGGFEFNPQRHDFSDKALLGQTVHGRGLAEVDQALDMLARHPATARFVARKLAQFWVGDTPSEALLTRLATEFQRTDGDIAALLRSLFAAPEFQTSLGRKLKDPAHYALSAARWRCDTRPLPTGSSVVAWLGRLGQSRFGRTTPDGYPLTADAWSSSGQLNTRFELAKTWGALREQRLQCAAPALAHATQQVLSQARSVAEWNMLRLAAPEFMYD